MSAKMNTKFGKVEISDAVIAQYASEAAYECFGIVGMALVSVKDGLVRLLKKKSSTKGINVIINEDNEIRIDFHIIVSYSTNIVTIADNVINSVKYKVEEFTGMTVKEVNVVIEGVRVID